MTPDLKALVDIFHVLYAMKPGESNVWFEIGKAEMMARLAIGSRVELPKMGAPSERETVAK